MPDWIELVVGCLTGLVLFGMGVYRGQKSEQARRDESTWVQVTVNDLVTRLDDGESAVVHITRLSAHNAAVIAYKHTGARDA